MRVMSLNNSERTGWLVTNHTVCVEALVKMASLPPCRVNQCASGWRSGKGFPVVRTFGTLFDLPYPAGASCYRHQIAARPESERCIHAAVTGQTQVAAGRIRRSGDSNKIHPVSSCREGLSLLFSGFLP